MRNILLTFRLIISGLLVVINGFGQVPEIKNIDKSHGTVEEKVTIYGSGFSSTASNLKVFFGGAQGRITFSQNDLIEVNIPAGATFSNIEVTNLLSDYSAYSKKQFYLSYRGATFDPAKLSGQQDFYADAGVYDLCACDFDLDGKVDIITSNSGSNNASVFRNTSTIAAVSFAKTSINLNSPSLNINCRDLDRDGKADLIFSRSGATPDRIFILRNTSTAGTISFAAPINEIILGTQKGAKRMEINDIDNDGRPEIIVSNQNENIVTIFPNSSSPGTLNFGAPVGITVTGATNTSGLAVEDLNNDGLPEIVTSNFLESNIYFIPNTSRPGSISFGSIFTITVAGSIANLKVGDLDSDGRADIAATDIGTRSIAILRNTSSNTTISFSSVGKVSTSALPWGLDFGDVDGDGSMDIFNTSVDAVSELGILRGDGSMNFTAYLLPVSEKVRNIKVFDTNGDAKPDLNFVSVETNQLSVILNRNCVKPEIFPSGPIDICSGSTFRLSATQAKGVSYSWKKDGLVIPGSSYVLDADQAGDYTVTVTDASGCIELSSPVTINVIGGTAPVKPVASNDGPACIGEDIQLSATTIAGATYEWLGPNNFSSGQQNPVLTNFSNDMVGRYFVRAIVSGCISDPDSTLVTAGIIGTFTLGTNSPTEFCDGQSIVLSVNNVAGHSYQWRKDGTDISGASGVSLSVNQSGSYTVFVTSPDGCSIETNAIDVVTTSPPVAMFTSLDETCIGVDISFTNTSAVDPNLSVSYNWDFGDGNTSTDANPVHQYSTAGMKTITLLVSYADATCNDTFVKNINIIDAASVNFSTDTNTAVCTGDIVQLTVNGTFNSILWDSGETTQTIQVSETGTYSVTVENSAGCIITTDTTLNFLPPPALTVTPSDTTIEIGSTVQLLANGALSYVWSPADGLSDPSIPNPTATPTSTTTYTVTGTSVDGCEGTTMVRVKVSRITNIDVTANKAFSPNGDGIDDQWLIQGIENYPDCSVLIFDRQGVKVYESLPYNNDWDGTNNGDPLKEGAYYYVIRCSGSSENVRTGSIAILR